LGSIYRANEKVSAELLGNRKMSQCSPIFNALAKVADMKLFGFGKIKHIVSPVRFTSELAAMQEAGADKFVEFGPGRTLTGLVKKTLKDVTAVNVEDMETLEGALS